MSNFWQNLKKPIIGLAPMDGITDFPMRQIQAEIAKPDIMYTEFISVEGFLRKPEIFLPHLKFSEIQKPIIAQLFGSNPVSFAKAIPQIVKLGFNGIDINMGCPSKNILEQGGGGALIGNFTLVEKIISSSLSSLSHINNLIPLSVKTRITSAEKDTSAWISFLSKFPISAICVHARPLKQLHQGLARFDQLANFHQLFHLKNIIFLGNGGIKNKLEGIEISQKYNLDGILIGQAAIGNPWVFSKLDCHCEDPALPETKQSDFASGLSRSIDQTILYQTIIRHSQLAYDFYGEKVFPVVRKHLSAYCKNFPGAKHLRLKLLLAKNPDEIARIFK